ncbi:hypothetical protein LINPERHAP1_LOCUS30702 [Linum perenne]
MANSTKDEMFDSDNVTSPFHISNPAATTTLTPSAGDDFPVGSYREPSFLVRHMEEKQRQNDKAATSRPATITTLTTSAGDDFQVGSYREPSFLVRYMEEKKRQNDEYQRKQGGKEQ